MSVIQFFIFVFCSHTPPSAETIPPAGSPRISISAVPSDIKLLFGAFCHPFKESNFADFKKEALQRKKAVKTGTASPKEFTDWLYQQSNVIVELTEI